MAAIVLTACSGLQEGEETGNVTINLPDVSANAKSVGRSISSDDIGKLQEKTVLYRVHMNDKTLEGTGGNFTAYFAVGLKVSIYVECLNSSGAVIIRTDEKTIVVKSSKNSVRFKLQTDGNEIKQSGGGTPVNITFNKGFVYGIVPPVNVNVWQDMSDNLAQGVTGITFGSAERVKGAKVDIPTLETHAFKGWVTSDQKPTGIPADLDYVTTYTGDMELYAIWEQKAVITLSAIALGGTDMSASISGWKGSTVYVEKNTRYTPPTYASPFTHNGLPYTPLGWEHGGTVNFGESVEITTDTYFYLITKGLLLLKVEGATIDVSSSDSITERDGQYYIWTQEPFILPTGRKNDDGSEVTEWNAGFGGWFKAPSESIPYAGNDSSAGWSSEASFGYFEILPNN